MAVTSLYWVFGSEPYWVNQLTKSIEKTYLERGFIKVAYDTQVSWQWPLLLKHQQAHDLFNPSPLIHLTWIDVHPDKEAALVLKTLKADLFPLNFKKARFSPKSAFWGK